jgi:hypothetical protein
MNSAVTEFSSWTEINRFNSLIHQSLSKIHQKEWKIHTLQTCNAWNKEENHEEIVEIWRNSRTVQQNTDIQWRLHLYSSNLQKLNPLTPN